MFDERERMDEELEESKKRQRDKERRGSLKRLKAESESRKEG